MAHDRKLVLGAVALVRKRVRNTRPAADMAREAIEPILVKSGWFPDAPFRWVGIIFRYGLVTDPDPEFGQIHPDERDLPIARELDVNELLAVHRDVDALARHFRIRTLECLLAVATRYDLPAATLESALAEEHTASPPAEPHLR